MITTEREELALKLEEMQDGNCFICLEPLRRDVEKWHIDHVVPRSKGGKDDENNYAITHSRCNLAKLDSDLRVARCMARYERIRGQVADKGPNRPNLRDFLAEVGGAKYSLKFRTSNRTIELILLEGEIPPLSLPLYQDFHSGLRYCFAELPIEYLHHDDRINPRAVGSRVRSLIAEFIAGRPQLHPSIGWITSSETETRLKIFDGQHKAVAQILSGTKRLPVRIFVDPNLEVLLETNNRAGTVLRQVAFEKSIQRHLGSQIFWEKIEAFRAATGRGDDDLSFSERQLLDFFKGEHRELKKWILDDVRTAVMYDQDNRLKDYVEFGGKGTEKPLSFNTIEKTFFSLFIRKEPMSLPMDHKLDIGENPRQLEKEQLLKLMNLLAETIFVGSYDFDRGTYRIEESLRKGEEIIEPHLRAVRLSREEILYNVLRYVRECSKSFFLMQERKMVEDDELFQKRFPQVLWEHIQKLLGNFAALPIWVNKEATISSAVFGGKQTHDFWKQIFETGATPAGVQVLAKGLTLDGLLA